MKIILEVEGDMRDIEQYLTALNIDEELIKSIKFERDE